MIKVMIARSAGIAFCLLPLGYGVRGLADHRHSRAPYVIFTVTGVLLGTALTPSLRRNI